MIISPPDREHHSLSAHQKAALLILMIVGLAGLILGIKSFGSSAKRPFLEQLAEYARAPEYVSQAQREEREVTAMRTRDTDEDKLTDYDEVYVYKTSPFLGDSDSDGFDDYTEVFSGNDPNCPVGKDCLKFASGAEQAAPSQRDTMTASSEGGGQTSGAAAAPKLGGLVPADAQVSSPEELEQFFLNLSADQIRQALMTAGIPKADLDRLDDAGIKDLFKKSFLKAYQGDTPQE